METLVLAALKAENMKPICLIEPIIRKVLKCSREHFDFNKIWTIFGLWVRLYEVWFAAL